MSMTPLERLIDAVQTALIAAQTLDRHAADFSADSRALVEAMTVTARCAHRLRTETGGA